MLLFHSYERAKEGEMEMDIENDSKCILLVFEYIYSCYFLCTSRRAYSIFIYLCIDLLYHIIRLL